MTAADKRYGLGQLRHLYQQMIEERITPRHMEEAARRLLAPGIEELEALHLEVAQLREQVTGHRPWTTKAQTNEAVRAVVEAARACYEADDFITDQGDAANERDQALGLALAALDALSGGTGSK